MSGAGTAAASARKPPLSSVDSAELSSLSASQPELPLQAALSSMVGANDKDKVGTSSGQRRCLLTRSGARLSSP